MKKRSNNGEKQHKPDRQQDQNNYIYGQTLVENKVRKHSQNLLNLVGYGLLFAAILDYADLLIPFYFQDPSWVLQTISGLVERVWIPILGLIFIFVREPGKINKLELLPLRLVSWLTLILGIFYGLMLPLSWVESYVLYRNQQRAIAQQAREQIQLLQQMRTGVSNSQSNEEIYNFMSQFNLQGAIPKIAEHDRFKKRLLFQFREAELSFRKNIEKRNRQALIVTITNNLKWSVGMIIGSAWFICMWIASDWIHQKKFFANLKLREKLANSNLVNKS